ncbi:TetR/AcrR family transcriptional regulator [Phenylobacterium montanum]|uniref:TetR/AcrR family transcriptional regulator n=1 Tax=Phenylobacterium montanum TaxID=2823693 RepID=A0A975G464_9CAUL|nr:TetR/AcrR family transcriptional regulator [Caulobacter sp. S6]QUD90248.1 TetR/AcrR family transcriptional regulator [Caulobacter sp. S6]
MARAAEETAAPTVGSARKPAQKRSLIRVNALLDAADALLQDREISDIGLYDVANAAKVPPTSAYHFFPTKESVFLALAERYLHKMHEALNAPLDLEAIERWQDFVTARYWRVVEYFNASLAARKLFMGTALQSDIRKLDFQDMDSSAAGTYRLMDRYFVMPYVRDPAFKSAVGYAIHDGIWAVSFAKHGYITPEYAREGIRATLAYMSTYLPDTIALRAPQSQSDPGSHPAQPEQMPVRRRRARARQPA